MSNIEAQKNPWVIIVGAGPAGLLLTLLLGQRGVHVQVLEASVDPDDRPRATHYSAPAVYELCRAGVAEEARSLGFTPTGVAWRKADGTYLTGFRQDIFPEDDPERMICLPLHKLGRLLLDKINQQPTITVSFNHKVLSVGQDRDSAWVQVDTPIGQKRLQAAYVVGCDGAKSQVRRSLFGDRNFPGRTWDEPIVATNVYYPFEKFGYGDANFFIDPEHWHMVARISKDGLWRVTYGEKPGLSHEELLARQPMKFQAFLPGHPTAESGAYKLANISPYRIHQRLAKRLRVSRILLAADAAHLCNPFGGMGLTGGIVDVGGLFDCLIGIYEGKADDSILDKYDEVRRKVYRDIIDPVSSSNIRRLFQQSPDSALQNDEFLRMCQKAENDDEYSRNLQNSVRAIMHDFTQYYKA